MLFAITLGYLALVNTLTFAMFRSDKRRAQAGMWRVPEPRLLGLALFGGWAGAKLAQRLFRHKTRKQPFGRVLNLIPLMWVAIGMALALPAALQSPTATAVAHSILPAPSPTAQDMFPDRSPAPRKTPKFFTRVGE